MNDEGLRAKRHVRLVAPVPADPADIPFANMTPHESFRRTEREGGQRVAHRAVLASPAGAGSLSTPIWPSRQPDERAAIGRRPRTAAPKQWRSRAATIWTGANAVAALPRLR